MKAFIQQLILQLYRYLHLHQCYWEERIVCLSELWRAFIQIALLVRMSEQFNVSSGLRGRDIANIYYLIVVIL